jgi:hypothetical protein
VGIDAEKENRNGCRESHDEFRGVEKILFWVNEFVRRIEDMVSSSQLGSL